jgi:transposase-like protein
MTIYEISDYPLTPQFCPRESCAHHYDIPSQNWFYRFGYYESKCRGRIPRFRCKACNKTFSTQTFSIHYWTHSTTDFEKLDAELQSCGGQRQIGRAHRVTHNVIANRVHRLARNYLASFDECYAENQIQEDCCFDGFESYLRNQYHPFHLNILIGKKSQMPYGCTLGLFRRKGAMTEEQKEIRDIIDSFWKQKKGAYSDKITLLFKDFSNLLPISSNLKPWQLFTDEASSYPNAIKAVKRLRHALSDGRMEHHTISSRIARNTKNPLFAVNYIDRELRKNQADHVRETVRQGREVHLCLSRSIIALGYHSFKKPYRMPNFADIRNLDTHGIVAKMTPKTNPGHCLKFLYSHRNVKSHLKMKMKWMTMIWERGYENPPIIDFKKKEQRKKWQPGSRLIARHLLC